jgi:hypothetical protein
VAGGTSVEQHRRGRRARRRARTRRPDPPPERARELGPRLHQYLVALESAQPIEQRREVDAAVAAGQRLDADPALLERPGTRRRLRREHDRGRGFIEHPRVDRDTQPRVEHDAQRPAPEQFQPRLAHRERRIIREHRAYSGDDSRRARAQPLHVGARRLARDPAADTAGERRAPVEACACLERDPGAAARHASDKAPIELGRVGRKQPALDGNTGARELFETATRDPRVRITKRGDYARHTGREQRPCAWGRATEMSAGLETDIRGGAARRLAGRFERMHLCVRAAGATVVALADYAAVAHQHAAHRRVRRCRIDPEMRQLERPRHV